MFLKVQNNSYLIRISWVAPMVLIVMYNNFLLGLQMIKVMFLLLRILFMIISQPITTLQLGVRIYRMVATCYYSPLISLCCLTLMLIISLKLFDLCSRNTMLLLYLTDPASLSIALYSSLSESPSSPDILSRGERFYSWLAKYFLPIDSFLWYYLLLKCSWLSMVD